MPALARSDLQGNVGSLLKSAEAAQRAARTHVEHCVQTIVGLGPDATLRRGYAIARDGENRPVGSKAEAVRHRMLQCNSVTGRSGSRTGIIRGGRLMSDGQVLDSQSFNKNYKVLKDTADRGERVDGLAARRCSISAGAMSIDLPPWDARQNSLVKVSGHVLESGSAQIHDTPRLCLAPHDAEMAPP
jgi:hypothetical protein